MFKCQIEISSKIQKSTTDERLKELLGNYITNLEKTLSDFKINLPINTADKLEINLLVLKSFDIETLKNINTLQIEYDLNMYEDYSCYIKYLIYTYDQAPDAYRAFVPTIESFMDYSNNIYMHQIRYE